MSRLALVGMVTAAALSSTFVNGPVSASSAAPCGPTAVAHRGGSVGVPESTMPAYRSALRVGVRVLEADVRMTADGVLVIMHDRTVDRTTDGTGAVRAMTYRQVRQLDAGHGAKVPRLAALLRLAKRRNARLILEVKIPHTTRAEVRRFVRTVRKAGMVRRTTADSFAAERLALVRATAPAMDRGLVTTRPRRSRTLLRLGSAVIVRSDVTSGRRVRAWQHAGLYVAAWTANDRGTWRALNRRGVDAVITDRPGAYQRWVGRGCR
ncbi:MAG TPA: glycerophosphodiester phosphodiesterase family protein [Nocardioidaceae bacterium]|nr:glycerophosphodiester phosphodiesterase family protein [Nocardioidaceae bacterium]